MSRNWDGEGRAPAPDVAFGKGYDVDMGQMQANESGANAYLVDGGDNTHVKLTITEVAADLRLAGSRGQSPLQADFYPRNFQQPTFTITIQARSQYDIGRVAEFVHKAQRNSVSQGTLMRLIIPRGGLRKVRAAADLSKGGMRGVRRGIDMSGYVMNMPRTHRRHDPAPKIVFEFVVARMHSGIFEDQPYKVYKLAKWSEIVDHLLAGNFIKPPLSAEQEQQKEAIQEIIDTAEWLGDILGLGD